jgi:hypothetical protein
MSDLPDQLPQDWRDFAECRANTVTIANGPIDWVELPEAARGLLGDAKPVLTISVGSAPGTAAVKVTIGPFSVDATLSVVEGRLSVDDARLPFLAPASVKVGLQRAVDEVNSRFASNGVGLAAPEFGAGTTTLRKVPRVSA